MKPIGPKIFKPVSSRRAEFLIVFLLLLVTAVVFLQVRSHDFIGYDDDWYVTENAQVRSGLTYQGIRWAFSSIVLGNWHPLTWLSHQLDVQLFGMHPGRHHLVNVLLHLMNTLLLYWVLKRMTGEMWPSCLVAAMFAIHPLHVESVAWIAERKDVLSGFFWMATMGCYVLYTEHPNKSRFLLTHMFFIMGLLSKPMLVTLPFVLLLLDYWPLKRFPGLPMDGAAGSSPRLQMLGFLLREKIGLFTLSFAACLVTFFSQSGGGNVGAMQVYPLTMRLANAMVAYVGYMAKMLWPAKLAVLYPHSGMPSFWQIVGAGVLLIAVTLTAFKHARRYPWLLVGWLWYLGTLVPVIGIVQVGVQSMADRYTYIPLIGLFVAIVWGAVQVLSRYRRSIFLAIPAAALVILLMSVTTWHQVGRWSDSVSLFQHAIAVTDGNYIMHNNLGYEFNAQGKTKEALAHYSAALAVEPGFPDAYLNIGVILASQGRFEAAVAKYNEALRIKPDFLKAHINLGNVRLRQGRTSAAYWHYLDALRINTASAEAYNGLGSAMAVAGKYEKAVKYFRIALQNDPGHVIARDNLDKTLAVLEKQQVESEGEGRVQK